MLRDGTAAAVRENELLTEVLPALFFVAVFHHLFHGVGEIVEELGKRRQHGARLEIEVLDSLLLVVVQAVNLRELLDDSFVGQRNASGELLGDGVVLERPIGGNIPRLRRGAGGKKASDETSGSLIHLVAGMF